MAFVGEKRAFIFVLPITVSLFYYLYYKYYSNLNLNFRSKFIITISIIIFSSIFIYFGSIYNPTLNPENIQGGSFDIGFVISYLFKYNLNITDPLASGRFAGIYIIFSQFDLFDYKYLFGSGPDTLIGFVDIPGYSPLREFGLLSSLSANGIVSYLISIGLIGTFSFVIFYSTLFFRVFKKINTKTDDFKKFLIFISVMFLFIFLFDFLIYSKGFINNHAISSLFFITIGITIKKNNCV